MNLPHYPLTNTGTNDANKVNANLLAIESAVEAVEFRNVCMSVVESDTAVAVADGTTALTIPASLNGLVLTAAIATVHTKGMTGTTDVQLRRRRAGADVDMLTSKITIGDEYYAADGVINAANDDIATGDQVYVDIDAAHSGTAPNGLSVTLTFGVA